MDFFSQTPSWGISLPELYFDGGTPIEKNIGTYGWVIRENGQFVQNGFGAFRRSNGDLTPHYAEFVAAIKGLQTMLDLGYDRVRVKGDNIHVIQSMRKSSTWDDPQIQQGADLARRLFHSFTSLKEVQKIHRSNNVEADGLARRALHIYQDSTLQAETDPILSLSNPSSREIEAEINRQKSVI